MYRMPKCHITRTNYPQRGLLAIVILHRALAPQPVYLEDWTVTHNFHDQSHVAKIDVPSCLKVEEQK